MTWFTRRMVKRELPAADLNQVFAGSFVTYYAFFERRIEELFVGLLSGKLKHPDAAVATVASFQSEAVARPIVFGGRKYVDWLPYEQFTATRATVFFEDGRPFSNLSTEDKAILRRLGVLRNALAHQSDHSLKRFKEEFVEGNGLPLGQQRPEGYLRGFHSLNQTRLEFQFSQAVAVAWKLCA